MSAMIEDPVGPVIQISADPLPADFRGTPQQFFDALVQRLRVTTNLVGVVVSDTKPASNQGLWLRFGRQAWVWDALESRYVPLDISASHRADVWIGESAPNPEEYKLWLKVQGTQVLGLYYWTGTAAGWVTKEAELQPGAVTSAHLQAGSVTTDKLAALAVTPEKLQTVPLHKLEKGSARQFLRMNAAGTVPVWEQTFKTTDEVSIVVGAVIEVEHGLGAPPVFVRPVFVCKEAEAGWSVGDEIDAMPALEDVGDNWDGATIFANATKVGAILGHAPRVRFKTAPTNFTVMTLAKWKLKFHLA